MVAFYTRKGARKNHIIQPCKECHKKRMATPRGKLRNRKSQLKRKYGLSLLAFESMSKQQSNSCAICKLNVPLCVDHDHKTGNVRGLLCFHCNVGLGYFKDEISSLSIYFHAFLAKA